MIASLHSQLIQWFLANQRKLPWREKYDPYEIWISEIMCQQTRIEAVIGFFHRWMEAIPNITTLAETPTETLLKLWEGLGYYRRVRMLQQASIEIVEKHNGQLPNQYEDLLKLPGIGPYSAAAISSIAFEQPHGVVDGNVKRVLSRLFAWQEPIHLKTSTTFFENKVASLIEQGQPRYLNQALMEFGALQCIPNTPRCHSCPITVLCKGFAKNLVSQLPNRTKAPITKKTEIALFLQYNNTYFLQQQQANEFWKGFWNVPLYTIETNTKDFIENWLQQNLPFTANAETSFMAPFSYTITVYRIQVVPILLRFQHKISSLSTKLGKKGNWFSLEEITNLPLTKPVREVLTQSRQLVL